MKTLFLLPFRSIVKNKGQSVSVMLSMILSVALIISISCLMYSAQRNKTESDREIYGDYHYYALGDAQFTQRIKDNQNTKEYTLEDVQVFELRDAMPDTDSFNLVLAYANESCRKMIRREIIEGEYPDQPDEIAMDRYTLRLLDAEDKVGEVIDVRGTAFKLSGIVKEPAKIDSNALEIFISENYENKLEANIIYLKFDENKDFYKQVTAFADAFDLEEEGLESNGELINGIVSSNTQQLINTIRITAAEEESNFTTLLIKLRNDFHLTSGLVSALLAVFGVFIIYSIFNVSVLKRVREYGILQTIGMGKYSMFLTLFIELFALLLVSYPVGVAIGLGIDRLLFTRLGSLFSGKVSLVEQTHMGADLQAEAAGDIIAGKFYIDTSVMVYCAAFITVLLIVISVMITVKVQRKTIVQLVKPGPGYLRKDKIYSTKNKSLLGVLTNRFMFGRMGSFLGVILSLSIGGIMIFSTNYVAANSKLNSEMILNSDDGLAADIRVFMGAGNFNYGITEKQSEAIKKLPDVESVAAARYFIGEIPIREDQLMWKQYWAEIADDPNWKQTPDVLSRFNGIVTRNSEGYRIKTNIYGYDEELLETLNDFVLEGEIDWNQMNSDDTVILRTIVDAQNNVGGIDIHAGDTITVKVPKKLSGDEELLRFDSSDDEYEEKQVVVSAVVRKSIVNNTEYIADEGLDIIMSNDAMERFFGIDQYNMLAIDKVQEDDTKVVSQIQQLLSNTDNIHIIDNTVSIQAKNAEFRRAEVLLYSIAVLLVIISLFHIINTMFHLIDSRSYAFAVLRAMGITETDFYRMLLKEALKYGLITCLAVFVLFFGVIQKILSNMLTHVYGYINHLTGVADLAIILVFPGIIIIFLLAVGIPARRILKTNIINELKQ